jgi:hypothetical protein
MTSQAESQTAPELFEQQLAVTRVKKLLRKQSKGNFRAAEDTFRTRATGDPAAAFESLRFVAIVLHVSC